MLCLCASFYVVLVIPGLYSASPEGADAASKSYTSPQLDEHTALSLGSNPSKLFWASSGHCLDRSLAVYRSPSFPTLHALPPRSRHRYAPRYVSGPPLRRTLTSRHPYQAPELDSHSVQITSCSVSTSFHFAFVNRCTDRFAVANLASEPIPPLSRRVSTPPPYSFIAHIHSHLRSHHGLITTQLSSSQQVELPNMESQYECLWSKDGVVAHR